MTIGGTAKSLGTQNMRGHSAVCSARKERDRNTSVVDPQLRVHGVQGLRVCDASVFPNLIAGNTNAPAIMVGWKGAEIILRDNP